MHMHMCLQYMQPNTTFCIQYDQGQNSRGGVGVTPPQCKKNVIGRAIVCNSQGKEQD